MLPIMAMAELAPNDSEKILLIRGHVLSRHATLVPPQNSNVKTKSLAHGAARSRYLASIQEPIHQPTMMAKIKLDLGKVSFSEHPGYAHPHIDRSTILR